MLNQVIIVGRLDSDPELKDINDKKCSRITLAVPRNFKNADGEYDTDLIPCVLWSNIASNAFEYCKKGDLIGIKGRMQTTPSKDKEGNSSLNLEIVADKVTFLASKERTKGHEDRDER